MAEIGKTVKGRGTANNLDSRFSQLQRETVDDGWFQGEDHPPCTSVELEQPKTIISRNQSPDLPFSQSINAYRGCEHGCIYCYARPSHAYLGLSPGLDFETRLTAKPDAARLLRKELQAKSYQCSPISLGANTDPYQPIERQYQITRQILEILAEFNHPVTIVTKSAMVERDIDILIEMAAKNLVRVNLSITTLKPDLARQLEPRASSPKRRLDAVQKLTEAGIPVTVLIAPIIPVLTDTELESILKASAVAGASAADFILVRLPLEVTGLFEEWLQTHVPDQAEHIMNRIRDSRDGKTNDARFGHRLRGHGFYADMVQQRFDIALRKYGLNHRSTPLNRDLFRPHPQQIDLF
ncbi:PA0069 family radical SAM protein [Methylophaga sp. OBS4]|uniref:PA0069 family radical SAM protein n=1 Tax=Methylophaga sp. OBS4 TaxID=2991935 RepID=UPI002256FFBF|nr:PA0069 family radical SAM protein [Methylophaga sp. OBS4]MCX4186708.1 PA0069 family radical SAM protein [Methylophaga sp. OBS4]